MSPRLVGLVLVVASTLMACAGNDSSPTTAGTSDDVPPAVDRPADGPTAPASGDDAGVLDVEATTVSGDVVDLGRYAGSDLALWFWAPW